MSQKPAVGQPFPKVTAKDRDGGRVTLAGPAEQWHMIVIYRGAHCPRCVTYLTKLAGLLPRFEALGVSVMGVTSDPADRAAKFLADNGIGIPFVCEFQPEAMKALGLYVSEPRDANETDRPFPEPGMFIVNPDGVLQVADISNSASFRPDLDVVLSGVTAMVERGMPIRGLAAE